MYKPSPPDSIETLLYTAQQLCGQNFATLAALAHQPLPTHFRQHKGWIGQLIEWHLGADAGSKPHPDFLHLGVELKTIPILSSGMPAETTFVCTTPLTNVSGLCWQQSVVYHKLRCVLWIPIEAEKSIPIAQRRIGQPVLWQPNHDEHMLLQQDWEEHMEKIALGYVNSITARQGQVLQIRPKAANSRIVTDAIGPDGTLIKTLPRGFYLRTQFTRQILQRCLSTR